MHCSNSVTMAVLHLYLSEQGFVANLKEIMSILVEICFNRTDFEIHQLEGKHVCMSKPKRDRF